MIPINNDRVTILLRGDITIAIFPRLSDCLPFLWVSYLFTNTLPTPNRLIRISQRTVSNQSNQMENDQSINNFD